MMNRFLNNEKLGFFLFFLALGVIKSYGQVNLPQSGDFQQAEEMVLSGYNVIKIIVMLAGLGATGYCGFQMMVKSNQGIAMIGGFLGGIIIMIIGFTMFGNVN